jgi:ubiquinone/menaquinone biosynthesis C-methylase UbiE
MADQEGMNGSPQEATIRSYDRVAATYMRQNGDRRRIGTAPERLMAHLPAGGLVLDVGCGPGFDAEVLREKGFRTVGVDLSRGMIALGKQHFPIPFVLADMTHLPFRAGVADGLWVNASMLHVPRERVPQVLREFAQVLRPEGMLYVSVQRGEGEGWKRSVYEEGDERWFAFWGEEELNRVLETAGFQIVGSWASSRWLSRCARNVSA